MDSEGQPRGIVFWFLELIALGCVLVAVEGRFANFEIVSGLRWLTAALLIGLVGFKWPSIQGAIAKAPRLKIVRPQKSHGQNVDLASGWESVVTVTPAVIRFLLKNVGLPRKLGHTTCFVTGPSGITTVAIERPGPVQFHLGVYFHYPQDFGPNAFLTTGSYHVRWETRMNVSDNPTVLYDGSIDVVITPPAG